MQKNNLSHGEFESGFNIDRETSGQKKTIRWGIIGTGNICSTFATALSSMKDVRLAAVASRDLSRAEAFAGRFGIDRAYGSYEELARDQELDVVYIGTPHPEHKENAALCIRHGKGVLCEKPFTLNGKDSRYLVELADNHRVFLMEALWTKLLPATRKVKEWIREGRIGEVRHMKVFFGFYSDFNPESRLYSPLLGGGALLDVGVYPISYVTYLLDRLPMRVYSSAVIGETGVDEQNAIIMKFSQGILAELSSAVCAEIGQDAEIIGSKGRIYVPRFWSAEEAMLYNSDNELVETIEEPFTVNGYVYEAEEVNRCLREGLLESKLLPLTDTLAIMDIMDRIRYEWGLIYPQEENER